MKQVYWNGRVAHIGVVIFRVGVKKSHYIFYRYTEWLYGGRGIALSDTSHPLKIELASGKIDPNGASVPQRLCLGLPFVGIAFCVCIFVQFDMFLTFYNAICLPIRCWFLGFSQAWENSARKNRALECVFSNHKPLVIRFCGWTCGLHTFKNMNDFIGNFYWLRLIFFSQFFKSQRSLNFTIQY